MVEGWKYFNLTVDIRDVNLTPVDEVLRSTLVKPRSILQTSFSGRSNAVFVYEVAGSPDEIPVDEADRDGVHRLETFQHSEETFYLFSHVEMREDHLLHTIKRSKPLIIDTPVLFSSDFTTSVRVIAPKRNVEDIYKELDRNNGVYLEKAGYCQPTVEDPLEVLTKHQREILRVALRDGYYKIPRQTSQEELGEHFDIAAQTVGEHLRKIESRLIDEITPESKSVDTIPEYGVTSDVRS